MQRDHHTYYSNFAPAKNVMYRAETTLKSKLHTVASLLTHTLRSMARSMGYKRVWVTRIIKKNGLKKLEKNQENSLKKILSTI